MSYKERFDELTNAYIERVSMLMKNKAPYAGIFGIGHHPKDDACHLEYYNTIKSLVEECCASSPSSDEADELAEALMKCDSELKEKAEIEMMFIPLQGFVKELVPFMSADKKSELSDWYKNYLPKKYLRFPVQNELCRALGI